MAKHISSLNIETFRGIKDLEINDLGDVNILVGDNNSGKSSILEALLLFKKPSDFSNVLFVSNLREGYRYSKKTKEMSFTSFMNIFNKLQKEKTISMSCMLNDKNVKLNITGTIEKEFLYDTNEPIVATPTQSEVESFIGTLIVDNEKDDDFKKIEIEYNKYSKIKNSNKPKVIEMIMLSTIDHIVGDVFEKIIKDKNMTKEVVSTLKIFDPNISDLRVISDDNGSLIQVIDHDVLGYMPLSTYGDGIKKVIAIANGIANAKNGILLIDEIETAIHTSALNKIFSFVLDACKKFNVQLFATTHSLEAVDKLLKDAESLDTLQSMRVITLVKKENQTIARVLIGEKALQVRDDYDMELR